MRCLKKIAWVLLLLTIFKNSVAQKIQYSSVNVFINNPDHLQLVANIAGNHHLVKFIEKEDPELFIFDGDLNFRKKINLPFKFPERSELRIVPFSDYYYLYVHPRFTQKLFFLKIDGDGNVQDCSNRLERLLYSQASNSKLGFQLISNRNELCMIYHTDITNLEKSTVMIVRVDSVFNIRSIQKVSFDFKREEEKIQQEILTTARELFVLKTQHGGTSLELMKINPFTGASISSTFRSSGYLYLQPGLYYNQADSGVTISSMLIEPRTTATPKRFVFVSRLDKNLIEEAPFAILRSQFPDNVSTNFLMVDSSSRWIHLRGTRQTYFTPVETPVKVYQDQTMPDPDRSDVSRINSMIESSGTSRSYYDASKGIRFSLLDKNFNIIKDSLVRNTKNSYTIRPEQSTRFSANNKEYLIVSQKFVSKSYGLLMVHSNDKQLVYTNLQVNDRYDYLVSRSHLIPQKGVIIPYLYKKEAGLIKITME